MPKKSTREDGRGHWPAGKARNDVPSDWSAVRRKLERLLASPERASTDKEFVRSRLGLARWLGVSDRQVRRWLGSEDSPSAERVAAIKKWMSHWAG
jgi:hypothetical protein